jgi:hypothetical protein
MKAIPVPVRERILELYGQGKSTSDIAASLGYCVAAVRRVRLQALVARQPDATLAELGARFQRPTSTMDLWLNRLGLSCKKNVARLRAVTARRSGTKKAVATAVGGRTGHPPGVRG